MQNRDDHAPGGGKGGTEPVVACAAHETGFVGIFHTAVKPVGALDIGKGHAGRQHRGTHAGQQAQDQNGGKKALHAHSVVVPFWEDTVFAQRNTV